MIDALRRDGVTASMLEAAGFEEPAALADAVALAANDLQLGAAPELWLPPLLASAEPTFGVRTLHQLVAMRRELGQPVELRDVPALAPLLGASRFMARRLIAHPDWIDALTGSPPEAPSGEGTNG